MTRTQHQYLVEQLLELLNLIILLKTLIRSTQTSLHQGVERKDLRKLAQKGLELIAGDGVACKCHGSVSHGIQEGLGINSGQVTFLRLPFPLEKAQIWPAIFNTILVSLNEFACAIRVHWQPGVWHPLPLQQITSLCIFQYEVGLKSNESYILGNSSNLLTTSKTLIDNSIFNIDFENGSNPTKLIK